METGLSTALCDVTMCPAGSRKMSNGELGQCLCGALIFSAHHNRLFFFTVVSQIVFIYCRYGILCYLTTIFLTLLERKADGSVHIVTCTIVLQKHTFDRAVNDILLGSVNTPTFLILYCGKVLLGCVA